MNAEVYINSLGDYLPESKLTVQEAVELGRYEEQRAENDGFTAVCVEESLSAPEMALRAVQPLIHGPADRSKINSLFLTSIHRHGHNHLWPPASFLHHKLDLETRTRVMSVNQGCNAGFIAASIAYDLVLSGGQGEHLIIGTDKFSGSGFDRFNSDLGTLYGDAAFAIRMSSRPTGYKVNFLAMESESGLESMYRNPSVAEETSNDYNVKTAKKAFLEKYGRSGFNALFIPALKRLRKLLLDEIDLLQSPVKYVIYPNVGKGLSAELYSAVFSDLAKDDMWKFGRSIGHTGTADQFLGMCEIERRNLLKLGDKVLLIGAGNGLCLAAMLLEKV